MSKPKNENMYEISLKNGFGPIKFGAPPSEVKSIWESELHYEDWMGGNLENFLYFKGLLIGFRGEIKEQPTEDSYACMFQVKTIHPLVLWNKKISSFTREDIESLLNTNKQSFKTLSNGVVQCTEEELQFHFNKYDILDEVYFANAYS